MKTTTAVAAKASPPPEPPDFQADRLRTENDELKRQLAAVNALRDDRPVPYEKPYTMYSGYPKEVPSFLLESLMNDAFAVLAGVQTIAELVEASSSRQEEFDDLDESDPVRRHVRPLAAYTTSSLLNLQSYAARQLIGHLEDIDRRITKRGA